MATQTTALEWERQVDIAICRDVLGWHVKPEQASQVEAYAHGFQLYDGKGHCFGWWRDAEDAWATGAWPYATDVALALSLAARERITITPGRSVFDPERHVWEAGRCNASGTAQGTRWIGMTNDRVWQRSASMPVAVCLAVLDAHGVAVPAGRPEN
jgi:hypothetical protein